MLHIQVYDLKSGLKLFKKRLLQSGVPFKVMISRQVIQGRGLLGGGGRDEHWTNWESCRELGGICCSLHCTNDTSFKQLLSHLKTISKTFCHSLLLGDYSMLKVMMKNPSNGEPLPCQTVVKNP